ncbi:hypothetical protein HOY80DRAFT_614512 [Tuber brumale]|nr:hypothetical protein HOY80DRAFT_614512 [Tuber brumale]
MYFTLGSSGGVAGKYNKQVPSSPRSVPTLSISFHFPSRKSQSFIPVSQLRKDSTQSLLLPSSLPSFPTSHQPRSRSHLRSYSHYQTSFWHNRPRTTTNQFTDEPRSNRTYTAKPNVGNRRKKGWGANRIASRPVDKKQVNGKWHPPEWLMADGNRNNLTIYRIRANGEQTITQRIREWMRVVGCEHAEQHLRLSHSFQQYAPFRLD